MNSAEIDQHILINIVTSSINGLSEIDRIQYADENTRFSAIAAMVKDLLQSLRAIGMTPPIEALQINKTQVLSFFNGTAEIISIEEAEKSEKRYLPLSDLKEFFKLDLNIKTFNFNE